MSRRSQPVSSLENIGPTVTRRLEQIGIRTRADLARVGPARAYAKIRARNPDRSTPVCYYLYSLDGALRGIHWDALPSSRKAELRRQADALGS